MKKILLHILFTVFCFVYALTLPAQNLGIATAGATAYPATNVGNNVATNNDLNVANNFLVADTFSTSWSGGTASAEDWTLYATYSAQPSASVTEQTNITCFAANDGTITITGSGGISPYTFSIDNGSNYPVNLRLFTGSLPNNQYKILVKNNVRCGSKLIQ